MMCSCRSDSSIRAKTRRMASSGTTPASGIGWPGSGGARLWSRRPSAWWTSVSPCSLALPETTRSATSYLCFPKILDDGTRRGGKVRLKLLGVLSMVLIGADAHAQHAPDGFVDAVEVVPGLVADIRYAGEHNFVGRPIDGYEAPRCLLTRPAAQALAAVQNDLATSRLGVKVFDCYRPARAVAHFVRWARDPNDIGRKLEFYPGIEKRDLFRLGYMSHR